LAIINRRKIPRFLIVAPVLFVLSLLLLSLTTNRSLTVNTGCGKCEVKEIIDPDAKLGQFNGQAVNIPKLSFKSTSNYVLGANSENKWIEVDLSDQKLRAWDGDSLYLESLVSTGLPWWPTPQGEFRIWAKVRATKMEGGSGRYYYNLPNVPYVMFMENDKVPGWRGYGLHGTYWHNDFGKVHSHGCVNLPTDIAEKLYYWTTPELNAGKGWIFSDDNNPGTRIVIHE
jgi:lipoprotein-anchoring transpeptidase ErfK/SrfK